MRIFVAFEDVRLPLDVQPGQTFGDIKTVIKDHFKLSSSQIEGKILQLSYAGAVLHDEWVCTDCGITSGSTIKSVLKDSDQPVLHIQCLYNNDILPIREQLDFSKFTVFQLRRIVAAKSGLPVSVFRLCLEDNVEIFDAHKLETYKITSGQTLKLHVWDGWNDLLSAATQGHTRKVFRCSSHDEHIAKFQFRAACHIAAHFGHLDLANSMINPKLGGVKPEEPVGEHPARLWSKASSHIDAWKCPVHVAAERGKLNVLRIFVQNNICCLTAKDGEDLTPMQVSFRSQQVETVQYLTSKLYSSHTENNITLPVTILIKAKKWSERAREQVLITLGAYKTSTRRRPYKAPALIGHGVLIDGFGESRMMSRVKALDVVQSTVGGVEGMQPFQLPGMKHSKRKLGSRRLKQFSESSGLSTNDQTKSSGMRQFRAQMSRDTGETPPMEDDINNNDSASYIQTPKPGDKPTLLPAIHEGKHQLKRKGRRMAIEGTIPLPAISSENTLRPFFHASSKTNNPVYLTLKLFEKYREIGARENAIQCMTIASTFKDKPWLRQVDLAISLAKRGVVSFVEETENTTKVLPTVAASPIKLRE